RSRPKPLKTQALVTELAIETLGNTILPRLAGLDQRGVDTLPDDPGQERLGHKLRAVVAAQERRCAALAHQAREHLDHPRRADAAGDIDPHPLLRELVSHRQALEPLAIGATVEHKVVGPPLVRPGWRLRTRPCGRNPPPRPLARHL